MAYTLLTWSALLASIVSCLVYLLSGALYRLYFHPLAKFPGPKFAALTTWYEYYYEVVCEGRFLWKIQELHERYGPIVRITPEELHIRDSEYFDEIYAPAAKKRDKYAAYVVAMSSPTSALSTVPHDLHRVRRGAMNPFFSKRAITAIEPLLQSKVDQMCQRFDNMIDTKEVVRLDAAYVALTMDIITHYAYGHSYNYLAEDDFKLSWKETLLSGVENVAIIKHFPWMLPVMKATPLPLLKQLNGPAFDMMNWQAGVVRSVDQIMAAHQSSEKKTESEHPTIFETLLNSDLPASEKSRDHLSEEGSVLVSAGSETTAKTLTHITFFLLSDPSKLARVRAELATVMPTPQSQVTVTALEKLPYFTACINEGIRLMYGVTIRLPRVSPTEPLQYKSWTIPPGTPVSQCNYFVHNDPEIFPDPQKYDPDRWLRAAEQNFRLDRYMVSFSKGSRMCIGINLAYAEIYLALAAVVAQFDMDLVDTDVVDVGMERDMFVGRPRKGRGAVKAVVTGRRNKW